MWLWLRTIRRIPPSLRKTRHKMLESKALVRQSNFKNSTWNLSRQDRSQKQRSHNSKRRRIWLSPLPKIQLSKYRRTRLSKPKQLSTHPKMLRNNKILVLLSTLLRRLLLPLTLQLRILPIRLLRVMRHRAKTRLLSSPPQLKQIWTKLPSLTLTRPKIKPLSLKQKLMPQP